MPTTGKTPGRKPAVKKKTSSRRRTPKKATAESMATRQREISVSEFFTKNRHLLGFDNPRKALLTTVKEAVDNALDACEEAHILPNLIVEIRRVEGEASEDDEMPLFVAPTTKKQKKRAAKEASTNGKKLRGAAAGPERYIVAVEDNGPGIMKEQVARIFGKLLYGSKFHRLRQSRGQQGIGISAAGMYGQLTTGKAVRIWTRPNRRKPAHLIELHMDLRKNTPEVLRDDEFTWDRPHATGTRVEIELEAKYQKGARSVDEYLIQTAIANPHVSIRYLNPEGDEHIIERATKELPVQPHEIKPHPYGVELGMLIQMLKGTQAKNLKAFLSKEFSRVSSAVAGRICDEAGLSAKAWVSRIARAEADSLHRALSEVKIKNPPTDSVAPVGEDAIVAALQRQRPGAYVEATTRPPAVYRGNPFVVEAGVAWGGDGVPRDELATMYRFANRVPLLYQQSACAVSKAVLSCPWRNYGVDQSRGALPSGPLLIFVHLASVWVPFTSESKEAIAHYPEILKDIRLAVMECGRKLGRHLKRERRDADERKKRDYIAAYLPHIVVALDEILGLNQSQKQVAKQNLKEILEESRS